jgi:hypothetical protein
MVKGMKRQYRMNGWDALVSSVDSVTVIMLLEVLRETLSLHLTIQRNILRVFGRYLALIRAQ